MTKAAALLCRSGLRGFDAAYSFGAYEGALRQLIHLFKYGKDAHAGAPAGRLLARAMPRDESFDAIVPVPLYWRRRLQRGFNQAELLARGLAKRRGFPWRGRCGACRPRRRRRA